MRNFSVTKWAMAAVVGAVVYAIATGTLMNSSAGLSLLFGVLVIALVVDVVRYISAPNLSRIVVTEFNGSPSVSGPVGIAIRNPTTYDITDIDIELTGFTEPIVGSNRQPSLLGIVGQDNNHFREWANADGSTIKSLDNQVVYFAKIEENLCVLLLEKIRFRFDSDNRERFTSPHDPTSDLVEINLDISFEIRGKIEGRVSSQRYQTRIVYQTTRKFLDETRSEEPTIHTWLEIRDLRKIYPRKQRDNKKRYLQKFYR